MGQKRQFDDVGNMSGERPDSDMLSRCERVAFAGRFSATRSECGPRVPLIRKRCAAATISLVLKGIDGLPVQLRRATLYPAELRVRRGSFSRLAGRRQRPCRGWLGEEQGPKGNGHTFESCRVRQEERVPNVPGLWRLDFLEQAI
jgi:hypothetical protein